MLAAVCVVVIVGSFASNVAGTDLRRGESCTTPNKETARCIPVNSCNPIKEAILTKSSSAIQFAKQSQCGYDSAPLVCCGSTGYLQQSTTNTPTIVTSFKHRLLPDTSVCGIETYQDYIYGGEITRISEFPWMALLRFSKEDGTDIGFKCGGSLINNRYVVTAAHCVNRQTLIVTSVRLGEWKITTNPDCLPDGECADAVVDVGIERIIPHNLYRPKSKANDIALIRLKRNIAYTDFIRPICIPSANTLLPEINSELYIAGWGDTERSDNGSDVKLKVKVPFVSNSRCASKLARRGNITHLQVCAGGVSGKDSCQGDSGGALMRYVETTSSSGYQYFLEGIISWGIGCGNIGYPGVYTRVAKYANWITSNMV